MRIRGRVGAVNPAPQRSAGYGDVTVHAGGFPNAVALAKQLVTSEEAAGRSAGGVFYDSDSTRQPKLNALLKQQQGGYVFKLSRC